MPNPYVIRMAGGMHLSPVLAFELGYSIFRDSDGTYAGVPTTISASSFQIAAIASLPLSRQFDLLGKLGLASNVEDWSDVFGTTRYSRSDLLIGLGAQFHISPQVSMRVLYDDYGKFDNVFPPLKATSLSLGVVYDFF